MLKSPEAEEDAQWVAEAWFKYGKEIALRFLDIIQRKVRMLTWETVVFSNRVIEIHQQLKYQQALQFISQQNYRSPPN